MALLRCPLPPDPGYEKTSNYFVSPYRSESQAGRVRPEAQEIAKMHTMGTIAMLLNSQPKQHITKCITKRPPIVNHHRANRRRIKEIQIKSYQQQQQASIITSPPRPSTRYSHIQSKVTTHSSLQRPLTAPAQYNKHFSNNSITKPDTLPQPNTLHHTKPNTTLQYNKPSITQDTQYISEPSYNKKSQNFVSRNITTASKHKVGRQKSLVIVDETKKKIEKRIAEHKKGVVPKYLCQRKEQWRKDEEERIANLPDPTVPDGHVLLPTKDKQNTLRLLKDHHTELLKEVQSLSLTADTVRIRQRKQELESKLAEVDDALKIFSRPKVFVKITDQNCN